MSGTVLIVVGILLFLAGAWSLRMAVLAHVHCGDVRRRVVDGAMVGAKLRVELGLSPSAASDGDA